MPRTTRPASLPLLLCLIAASGCGSTRERHAVPAELVERAQIPGMPDVRVMFDLVGSPSDSAAMQKFADRLVAQLPAETELAALTISGGGSNGAFGAGVLCGWTEQGTRPVFQIVTGVSTGALIAPFAFLGPAYDAELRELYTTLVDADIYEERSFFGLLGNRQSLADTTPLADLVRKRLDRAKLDAVAAEHARGRRLFVGTANLDGEQLVVWDMGAIAASGHEKALELFQNVLVASAAIPVVFPPVFFDVEVDGKKYDEMHADGGVMTQVFGAALLATVRRTAEREGKSIRGTPQLYVLRNAQLAPLWKETVPKLGSIAGRTVSTMIKTQGFGDLYRAYLIAQLAGLEYHAAWMPVSFTRTPETEFETAYMKELFDIGYALGRDGDPWSEQPPLLEMLEGGQRK